MKDGEGNARALGMFNDVDRAVGRRSERFVDYDSDPEVDRTGCERSVRVVGGRDHNEVVVSGSLENPFRRGLDPDAGIGLARGLAPAWSPVTTVASSSPSVAAISGA